jgi:hypothetical protein
MIPDDGFIISEFKVPELNGLELRVLELRGLE